MTTQPARRLWVAVICAACSVALPVVWAGEEKAVPAPAKPTGTAEPTVHPGEAADEQRIRLSKQYEIWIDRKDKTVIVGGEVCLREGPLEMFACPRHTKEHESIVAVNSKAFLIHAGLLAVGARPGQPAQFEPKYVPARGDEIDVQVVWKDQSGQPHKVPAQQWIRRAGTQQSLRHPWVFVGSNIWTDPKTGRRFYDAEGGDLICVSNFPTAMMDLPIPSSQSNEDLLFEAFTERIPPRGTKVELWLRPRPKADKHSPTLSRSGLGTVPQVCCPIPMQSVISLTTPGPSADFVGRAVVTGKTVLSRF